MHIADNKLDLIFLCLLVLVLAGLPLGIMAYDNRVWHKEIPQRTRTFTLTGHTERGWLLGEVHAFDAVTLWGRKGAPMNKPTIRVSKGDRVVLKLKSSDVVHGFSLKDFEVFITEGIEPGKVTLVSFKADKAGTFTFSCNAICGDNHKNMQGTLIVQV